MPRSCEKALVSATCSGAAQSISTRFRGPDHFRGGLNEIVRAETARRRVTDATESTGNPVHCRLLLGVQFRFVGTGRRQDDAATDSRLPAAPGSPDQHA